MEIDYTVISSRLGRVLIGATPLGICAVEMGNSDAALVKALIHRHPRAKIRRNPALLRGAARKVLGLISGESGAPELPLDVRATAFQARVWAVLRSIPAGRTATYGEIARRIGRPGSARAVGRAIAFNPVALIIPCHRAVAAGGRLSGYHWGPHRKRRILELERNRSPRSPVRRRGGPRRRKGASET